MGPFDVTQALLERAMSGASLRQTALSNNIANANTAGYKRSDVDFASTLAGALDSGDAKQQIVRARLSGGVISEIVRSTRTPEPVVKAVLRQAHAGLKLRLARRA